MQRSVPPVTENTRAYTLGSYMIQKQMIMMMIIIIITITITIIIIIIELIIMNITQSDGVEQLSTNTVTMMAVT